MADGRWDEDPQMTEESLMFIRVHFYAAYSCLFLRAYRTVIDV